MGDGFDGKAGRENGGEGVFVWLGAIWLVGEGGGRAIVGERGH